MGDHSDPGVTHRTHISIEDLIRMILLLLLTAPSLVTPGRAFHLPEDQGAAHTGTPHTCQASDNHVGLCLEITKCKSVEHILENQITKEKLKFLSKFSCGFTNNIPKICCPIEQNVIHGRGPSPRKSTTRQTTTTTTTKRFRHVEETTKPSKHTRNNINQNDLRFGFGGWAGIKCSSEFCKEPK